MDKSGQMLAILRHGDGIFGKIVFRCYEKGKIQKFHREWSEYFTKQEKLYVSSTDEYLSEHLAFRGGATLNSHGILNNKKYYLSLPQKQDNAFCR